MPRNYKNIIVRLLHDLNQVGKKSAQTFALDVRLAPLSVEMLSCNAFI